MNTNDIKHTDTPHHRSLTGLVLSLGAWFASARDDDRGDVPGWVMITLMSAMLVAGLMIIAGDALESLFKQAISQVSP